ncbi:hypothetical protein MKEN_00532200 [Mycena kentingensis (nom. inval.)]|nr:hypothetical protein MKEN_00532200 [Mycena kentingensis (nom. inval.)]
MALTIAAVCSVGVFVCYFSVIAFLFTLIVRDLATRASVLPVTAYVFIALTIASFTHTWFYMFNFMAWSFHDYESTAVPAVDATSLQRLSQWLLNTSLFEQAWAGVCFGRFNWWWSQQLCLFTVGPWTIFLASEGPRFQVKRVWAYMLLGQLVAISVASNLFYLALVLSPQSLPTRINPHAPLRLWLPVLISFLTVGISPFTNEQTFLPNLLLMHTLIVVPLVSSSPPNRGGGIFTLRRLYAIVCISALILHLRASNIAGFSTNFRTIPTTAEHLWTTLHSHPAQSSIGWDVIWTTISCLLWTAISVGPQTVASMLLDVGLGSIGFAAMFTFPQPEEATPDERKQE